MSAADAKAKPDGAAVLADRRPHALGELLAALPKDVLVVVSKLKAYIRAASGMNTSDDVVDFLSDELRKLCNGAISEARFAGRKTVMERDFKLRR